MMNNGYLFIWDEYEIQFFDLTQPFFDYGHAEYKKKIKLSIHRKKTRNILEPMIFEVRCSSHINKIGIIVNLVQDQFTILGWDVKSNQQTCHYDVKKPFEILWDSKGHMYIAHENKIMFSHLCCNLKIYDFQNLQVQQSNNPTQNHSQLGINMSSGIKFDGKNHNWLIFEEYIATPFSYMTFVIRDKIGEGDAKFGEIFDPEPFQYLFNKSSSFLDDIFVALDHKKLEEILNNFKRIDEDLLEILNYSQSLQRFSKKNGPALQIEEEDHEAEMKRKDSLRPKLDKEKKSDSMFKFKSEDIFRAKNNTSLHMAVCEGNNKCVNIILHYMSQTKFINSQNISEIFYLLVEYKSFLPFFEKIPIKTYTSQVKQVLKVKEPWSKDIVVI